MTRQEFTEAFASALISKEVSEAFVREQSELLSEKLKKLSDSDFEKRSGQESINMLVASALDEYLVRTRPSIKVQSGAKAAAPSPTVASSENEKEEKVKEDEAFETAKIPAVKPIPEKNATIKEEEKAPVKEPVNEEVKEPVKVDPKEPEQVKEKTEEAEKSASENTVVVTKKTSTPRVEGDKTTTYKTESPSKNPKKEASKRSASSEKLDRDIKNNDVVTIDMAPVIPHNIAPLEKKRNIFTVTGSDAKTASLIFTILTVLALPLIITAALASVSLLASLYLVLAAVIIGIILAIFVVVCAGSLTSLIALLYGATQVMQTPRYVGIHELGIALIAAGGTLLVSVILYNIAVRLIPWILTKAAVIFKFAVLGVKRLAEKVRKGCEKL